MKITSFIKPKQKIEQQPIKSTASGKISEKESGLKALNLEKNGVNEKIYKTLKANDIQPTKEMIQSIKGHFEKIEGPLDQKIKALDLMLKKDIEVTLKNLVSIHQTLKESIDYGEIFKNLKEIYQGKENIDYKEVLNGLDISEEGIDSIQSQFDLELTFNQNISKILKVEKLAISIKDRKILERVINKNNHESIEVEEDIDMLLTNFEKNVSDVLNEIESEMADEAHWLPMVDNFRKFLVEKTTEKMHEVKMEFDQFKGEVSGVLEEMIESPKKQLTQENLEKMIQTFEKVIMKSDITLYTSMSEEKQLIQMASLLDEAKTLANNNEEEEAKQLLINIKKMLDRIDFKPKEAKVKAFMKADLKEVFYGKKAFVENLESQINQENKGPRENLEIMRSIGMNHESEVVQNLEQRFEEKMPMENIKNILMSLMTSGGSDEKSPEIKSTIDNITGQQLLSKLEVKSNIQTMTLNIPYMAENKIKSLDLFIQAKKESEKIDWKNSTLYFVMDLNRYGKTGIKIQSVNKVVNMTVKNNNDAIEEETKAAFESFLEELTNEGYKKGFIQYYDFDASENSIKGTKVDKASSVEEKTYNFEKGFDLKI